MSRLQSRIGVKFTAAKKQRIGWWCRWYLGSGMRKERAQRGEEVVHALAALPFGPDVILSLRDGPLPVPLGLLHTQVLRGCSELRRACRCADRFPHLGTSRPASALRCACCERRNSFHWVGSCRREADHGYSGWVLAGCVEIDAGNRHGVRNVAAPCFHGVAGCECWPIARRLGVADCNPWKPRSTWSTLARKVFTHYNSC